MIIMLAAKRRRIRDNRWERKTMMLGQTALMTAQEVTAAAADDTHSALFRSAMFLGSLALLAVFVVLFIAALVSVLGSPLTGGMKLVWVVVTFMAPVLGPLVWFVFGRRDAYRRSPATTG